MSFVIHGNIKLNTVLPSGAGDAVITVDPSTKLLGEVGAIDTNTFIPKTLPAGNIIIGNASGEAVGVVVSGDVTTTPAGVFSITAGVIVNDDVSAVAGIAYSKMATLTASRALISNASGVLTPSSVTDVELSRLSGVTSSVQTQLDSKIPANVTTSVGDIIYKDGSLNNVRLPIGPNGHVLGVSGGLPVWEAKQPVPNGGTTNQYLAKNSNTNGDVSWYTLNVSRISDLTATAAEINVLGGTGVTSSEISRLSGVTSNIQVQLNTKQDVITGAPSSVLNTNLNTQVVVVSDLSGKLTSSTVTTNELDYLIGVTGPLQAQLTNKQDRTLPLNAIWVGNVSGLASALSAGVNGSVLTIVSGTPSWQPAGSGGTVTSVALSPGTTGLTVTGSPITTSGTMTLGGVLAVANGGTGASTVSGAPFWQLGGGGALTGNNTISGAFNIGFTNNAVGVGTSSPGARLDIRGSGFTSASINFRATTSFGVGDEIIESRDDGSLTLGYRKWLVVDFGQRFLYRGLNLTGIFSVANDANNGTRFDLYGSFHATKPGRLEIFTTSFAHFINSPVLIGGTTLTESAILDVQSTTRAVTLPRMTTAQRDAIPNPSASMLIYNTSTNVYNFHNGTTWGPIGGLTDGDYGDVTVSGSGTAINVDAGAITYAKIQNVAANSFLANVTGSSATVQAVATNRIPLFSSAITGTPSSTTFLRGDGAWITPSGTGDVVGPSSSLNNRIAQFSGTTGKLIKEASGLGFEFPDLVLYTTVNPSIYPTSSFPSLDLTIRGGNTTSPNTDGGHLYLTYGNKNGTGLDGNIGILTTGGVSNWQSMARGIFIANAAANPTGNPSDGIFHYINSGTPTWRNPSGHIFTLQRLTALTAANNGTLNTGDATSDTIIGNMRTRIAELESRLQSLGILP